MSSGRPDGGGAGNGRLYDLLGVSKDASQAEIKGAYRKAAVNQHPDKGGDPEKFRDASRAYEVLGNPELRKQYDAHGEAGVAPGAEPADISKVVPGGGVVGGDGQRPRGRDLVLPLDVTLEEMYSGAVRRVAVNHAQLRRAHHVVAQDIFEVPVDRGARDGHWVTFHGKANPERGADPGDVSFVLQERWHPTWQRKNLDLYTQRTITLLEALTGYHLVIRHLDGRKLVVKSRPGEIVHPRNTLPDAEAEWERYDHTDAFPGEDAGAMKTDDLEACKEVCRQKGYAGFTYWEDTAYFRSQDRASLLSARKKTKGSTLFICPDPQKSASMRMQRAIRGAGMPSFENPLVFGNLFLLLKVELPARVDEDAAKLLREVLPPGPIPPITSEHADAEELVLCDLDPVESQRLHHIATGSNNARAAAAEGEDEAPPVGSPGPPPCRQM